MSALKIKNADGEWQEVPMLKGRKGDKGDAYNLTEQDKEEIAGMVSIPLAVKDGLLCAVYGEEAD